MIATELQGKIIAAGEGMHLTVMGMDNVTIKLTGEETGGAFAVSEHTNAPGNGVPLHIHRREDETFYITEGEVEVQVGDETIIARKGDTAFLPRDVPHSWRVTGDATARMLVVVTPAGLDEFFSDISRLPSDEPPDVEHLFSIAARYGIEFPSSGR
jgi:quercetin dioxygenase-like cupin family protein